MSEFIEKIKKMIDIINDNSNYMSIEDINSEDLEDLDTFKIQFNARDGMNGTGINIQLYRNETDELVGINITVDLTDYTLENHEVSFYFDRNYISDIDNFRNTISQIIDAMKGDFNLNTLKWFNTCVYSFEELYEILDSLN